MTKVNYHCSQAVFVVAVNTALDSMQEFLAQFTAYKPRYVQAWIDALRALLVAAETLPDEDARRAASEILRVNLVNQNLVCCKLWQTLKRYITDAYAPDIVDIQLAAAGQAKYEPAYRGAWAEGKAMLTSAKNFMAVNLEAITADGNMPPIFPDQFNAQADLFNTILTDYESSKEAILLATQVKTEAYNEVHRQLMPMMLDGQEIFRNNEAVLTQFVYADVLGRISGPGLAGIRGNVTNSTNNQPIPNASVALTILINTIATTYTITTNAEGFYELSTPSGTYDIAITAEGYTARNLVDYTIAVGTMHRLDIALDPVPVP